MEFKSIRKLGMGKFITRYDITYETSENNIKVYEMISRDPEIASLEQLKNSGPDAVVIIATDESGERILLNREFRLASGRWIYNFPAGLIEKGEALEVAAKRELFEETGLELYKINDTMGISYSAVGFSNETNVTLVGKARGEFKKSSSDLEEIEAGWFTKDEVKKLLESEPFAARTQAFCYIWCGK